MMVILSKIRISRTSPEENDDNNENAPTCVGNRGLEGGACWVTNSAMWWRESPSPLLPLWSVHALSLTGDLADEPHGEGVGGEVVRC